MQKEGKSVFVFTNPNPKNKHTGDCTIRAVSLATGQSWDAIHVGLSVSSYAEKDLQNNNAAWGRFLRWHGWRRRALPDTCPDCYTVADFAADHPRGVYIVACEGHVVCVRDGNWYDTWDSGGQTAIYYWTKER